VQAVHPVVEAKRDEIVALCRELGIHRLDVFGSAVSDDFDVERSDVDVLVDFETTAPGSADTYFALKWGLESILGRPVDVVVRSAIRNPYFRAQALGTSESLFAA
jgi:predicted nucleotidyltransferase